MSAITSHPATKLRPSASRRATSAALLGIALVAVTAGAARSRATLDARATPLSMTITARDYAFDAPDTVTAGVTTIHLRNQGPELHHVMLFRLDEGRTLAEFFTAVKAGGPPPSWVHEVGGPNAPAPGGESVAALDLAPGHYAITCFIPSKDGVPHVMKGMAHELVAVAPRRAAVRPAAYSAPSNTITLTDYHFALAHPITAGTHTIRVRNGAAQAHEIFIVKLFPGKTAANVAEWAEKEDGPAPGLPLGGTTGMAPGAWNDITMTFEPGDYAVLCFWPDAKDGKPHIAHGMMTQITVR